MHLIHNEYQKHVFLMTKQIVNLLHLYLLYFVMEDSFTMIHSVPSLEAVNVNPKEP